VNTSKNEGKGSNFLDIVPISSIMTKEVRTANEDQSLYEVCKIMHENDIGSVVITKRRKDVEGVTETKAGEEPVGIITERDVVNKIALKLDPASYRSSILELFASKIMSTPLITIFPNGTIRDAMETMFRKNIRRLVVVTEAQSHHAERTEDDSRNKFNTLIGIVTDKDIFKAIINNQDFITEILADRSFISHKDVLERLGENLFGERWRK
jgi:CBS domain-containing protein